MADHHDYTHYHTHSNDHANDPDLDGHTLVEGEVRETALRELLLEKGVITTPELNDQMNRTASQSAAVGASIIAKAWKDQKFKKAVLANPKATIADLGHDVLAVADAHEIAKVSHRFGIGRRRRPADEHQRPRSVVHVPNLVRFVITLFPRQRHAAQVQHLKDVHRAQLVRQR